MLAHWTFGGGWLHQHGTLDFSVGVPVEIGSGFSALAAALVVGARKDYGRQALLPHNGVHVLLGAPSCTLLVWFLLDLLRERRVTAIGAATAVIVGCVGITPAGGYVSPAWAMALGALAAMPSHAIILWRPRTRADETLDVLAAHGMAGVFGIVFLGLVAQASWNGSANGLLYGSLHQLAWQAVAALAAPAYAFTATSLLLRGSRCSRCCGRANTRRSSGWMWCSTARRPTPLARERSGSRRRPATRSPSPSHSPSVGGAGSLASGCAGDPRGPRGPTDAFLGRPPACRAPSCRPAARPDRAGTFRPPCVN